MSSASDATIEFVEPPTSGPLTIAVQHRNQWVQTQIDIDLEEAICKAHVIFARSGLPAQVRDAAGRVLFEVGA